MGTQVSHSNGNLAYAIEVVDAVCCLSGVPSYVDVLQADLRDRGIVDAIKAHDTTALFEFLVEALSFQGISNTIAANYIAQHGNVRWSEIEDALSQAPPCPKLAGYWRFHACKYSKWKASCAEPRHIESCPLPHHPLRNGHLSQMAYSLFFFMRDIADGDFVGWIDRQIASVDQTSSARLADLQQAIIGPLRNVYGVSDKTLVIALSSVLMALGRHKPLWLEIGMSLIAVDTLVHNFLHRTGILQRFAAEHAYGDKCYGPHGCAAIIRMIAAHIDARQFNPAFPALFPRFVQHAIWRYCAAEGLNMCNGNRIRDCAPCENANCELFHNCDRITLRAEKICENSMA
jgi:hypothetical protein